MSALIFCFPSFLFRLDRTPPQVTITSKPTSPSNQNSFTFRFSCGGTCSFQCSVAQMGSRPAFTQCNSNRYTASSLQNGLVYVFQVRGTDDVGNQGSSVNYTWKVGKQPVQFLMIFLQSSEGAVHVKFSSLCSVFLGLTLGKKLPLRTKLQIYDMKIVE